MNSETTANGNVAESQQGWIAWGMQRRWVRLTLLVSIAIFEIGLTYLTLHYGWFDSINLWTYVGVAAIGLLPLLVGIFVLFRRRFSMKSVFVALTMFALFMALTFRPVYEARRSRAPAKKLIAAGVMVHDRAVKYVKEDGWPRTELADVEKSDRSKWWIRLLGEEAGLPTSEEIYGVQIEDAAQLEAFAKVSDQLPNLLFIGIKPSMPVEELEQYSSCFENSGAIGFGFSAFKQGGGVGPGKIHSLGWLERCEQFRVGTFTGCNKAPELFLDWEDANVEVLSFYKLPNSTAKVDWLKVFECPVFQSLQSLSLTHYKLTAQEAEGLGKLQELRSLSVSGVDVPDYQWLASLTELKHLDIDARDYSDFGFLKKLEDLRELQVLFGSTLTDRTFPELVIPKSLRKFTITVPRSISKETFVRIGDSLPEGCEFIHNSY